MKLNLGVDPGVTGALALVSDARDIISLWDMPSKKTKTAGGNRNQLDLVALMKIADEIPPETSVILERQWARSTTNSGDEQSMQSMGRMMEAYGRLYALFFARGFLVREVSPQKWRGRLGLQSKSHGVEMVQRLYPGAPVLGPKGGEKDGRADAILIAHWGHNPNSGHREGGIADQLKAQRLAREAISR